MNLKLPKHILVEFGITNCYLIHLYANAKTTKPPSQARTQTHSSALPLGRVFQGMGVSAWSRVSKEIRGRDCLGTRLLPNNEKVASNNHDI